MTLAKKVSPAISATVRSTPLMAIESPSCASETTRGARMRSVPAPASITSPTSSMIPVNMREV